MGELGRGVVSSVERLVSRGDVDGWMRGMGFAGSGFVRGK